MEDDVLAGLVAAAILDTQFRALSGQDGITAGLVHPPTSRVRALISPLHDMLTLLRPARARPAHRRRHGQPVAAWSHHWSACEDPPDDRSHRGPAVPSRCWSPGVSPAEGHRRPRRFSRPSWALLRAGTARREVGLLAAPRPPATIPLVVALPGPARRPRLPPRRGRPSRRRSPWGQSCASSRLRPRRTAPPHHRGGHASGPPRASR